MLGLYRISWVIGVISLTTASAASGEGEGEGTAADIKFVDVAEEAGLSYSVSIPNTMGNCVFGEGDFCLAERITGGVAVGDFDGDTHEDVYVTRIDGPDYLYRNNGDGTFADITEVAGLGTDVGTNGAAWFDADNDGDLDLYVTGYVTYRHFLYINDGTGHFDEQAVERGAAVETPYVHAGFSVATGDYDGDGWTDLYACEWRPDNMESPDAPSHSRLLRNLGSSAPGYFKDVTEEAGLTLPKLPSGTPGIEDGVYTFGAAFVDFDKDNHLDLAISADFGTSWLFWNNGDGTFTNGTDAAGTSVGISEMGHTLGDYDGDGDLDWFVTAIHFPGASGVNGNLLYAYDEDRTFVDVAPVNGVRNGLWGWGAAFSDFDNDADLDLTMTNGIKDPAPFFQFELFETDPMRYWENDGSGDMLERGSDVGITDTGSGKGLAVFDYDDDGDRDIIVINNDTAPVLYRNDGGNANDWLRVKFTSQALPSFEGLNARIELTAVEGGAKQYRELGALTHFLGQSERVAHFGLGFPAAAPVHEVRITWPRSGIVQTLQDVPRNETLIVTAPPEEVSLPETDPPTVVSFKPTTPVATTFSAAVYRIVFDRYVSGVEAELFSVVTVDGDATGSVDSISPGPSDQFDIVLGGLSGEGTLRLELAHAGGIADVQAISLADGTYASEALPLVQGLPQFTDVSAAAGVWPAEDCSKGEAWTCDATAFAGGVAVGDFDADGWPDLYLTRTHKQADILLRNRGDGSFALHAMETGLNATHDSLAASWGDIDFDGDLDLVVTTQFEERNYLYINHGLGRFTEEAVTRGVATPASVDGRRTALALADFDADGWLDVLILESLYEADAPGTLPASRLLRNRGVDAPGYFEDVTQSAGIAFPYEELPAPQAGAASLPQSAAFVDLDQDGALDLAITGDYGQTSIFWGNGFGMFVRGDTALGLAAAERATGSTFGDIDRDGDLDWFVNAPFCPVDCVPGALTGGKIFLNDGGRMFTESASVLGITDAGWGQGATFFDFDNDRDLDLLATNGIRDSEVPGGTFETDSTRLWRREADGGMPEVAAELGLLNSEVGRGVATLDFDQDGDLDVIIANEGQPPVLFRNDGGNLNDWIRIEFVGLGSIPRGLNASITLIEAPDGPTQRQDLGVSAHFLAQSELVAHFGLAGASQDPVHEVQIRWPRTGTVQVLKELDRNQKHVIQVPIAELYPEGWSDTDGEEFPLEVICDSAPLFENALASAGNLEPGNKLDWRALESCSPSGRGATSAYRLQVTHSGVFRVTVSPDAASNVRVHLLRDCAGESPECIAFRDEAGDGIAETLVQEVSSEAGYLLIVEHVGSGPGSFDLFAITTDHEDDSEGELEEQSATLTAGSLLLVFLAADVNGDGLLGVPEVLGAGVPVAQFQTLDDNGDGRLTISELLRIAEAGLVHSADTNADKRVSFSELLRVVQFYNADGYHCARYAADTEDGYRAGPEEEKTACIAHASDYVNRNFRIELRELLRTIQLFNSGGYASCDQGEDFFCTT